jgi:hypothetical protein
LRLGLSVTLCCYLFPFIAFASSEPTIVEGGVLQEDELGANLEDHPDPNDEHYSGMIYVGKHDEETGRRIGFDRDNGIRYIFGTSFDESHKQIEEKDLLHHPLRPVHDIPEHEREQILRERRHGTVGTEVDPKTGQERVLKPKAFGHVEEHPLDGGVVPPKIVHVDPYFLDETLVTNKEFGKFVRATYYETEAEKYGWSFVLDSMVDKSALAAKNGEHGGDDTEIDNDPEAEHWIVTDGAYWRRPEGPDSSYKVCPHPRIYALQCTRVCVWNNNILCVAMIDFLILFTFCFNDC